MNNSDVFLRGASNRCTPIQGNEEWGFRTSAQRGKTRRSSFRNRGPGRTNGPSSLDQPARLPAPDPRNRVAPQARWDPSQTRSLHSLSDLRRTVLPQGSHRTSKSPETKAKLENWLRIEKARSRSRSASKIGAKSAPAAATNRKNSVSNPGRTPGTHCRARNCLDDEHLAQQIAGARPLKSEKSCPTDLDRHSQSDTCARRPGPQPSVQLPERRSAVVRGLHSWAGRAAR